MKSRALQFALLLLTVFLPIHAFAGFAGYNASDKHLGVFSSLKCSTGLTCTVVGGKFSMVSSPNLASALTLSGDEATDAVLTLSADQSDDSGDDWVIRSVDSGNALTFSNDTSGSAVVKMQLSTAGALSGYKQAQVAATATTITSAQCGSTFINASGAVEMELPEASTVLGCRLTFIVGSTNALTIDPDAADQILLLTNAAGDAIAADAAGESVVLEAISATQWAPVGAEKGSWTDAN
jgi:hypothetical protein